MKLSFAEYLLTEVAEPLRGRMLAVMEYEGKFSEQEIRTAVARIKVALDFNRKPSVFKLRAIVEGWDEVRLVREMY